MQEKTHIGDVKKCAKIDIDKHKILKTL